MTSTRPVDSPITIPTAELVPDCLGCAHPMTPADGGYTCPACGTTSGPVAR
jgi:Zn finger protein HypA/HybF involved in hydrogenase expression